MGIALRQELDPADRADIIGLLHRIDELVAVEAASALDRLGDDVDVVIGGIAAIRWIVAEFLHERVDERQRLRRHRHARTGHALIDHAVGRPVGVLPECRVGRLRGDAEHRDRHLLALPLHRRLHSDMRDAGDDHVRFLPLDLVEDRGEVGGVGREADVVENFKPDLRQAGLVAGVERRRPGGVLAHDHRRLHLEAVDQHVLGGVADEPGERARGQVAVEGVFVVLVVLGDVLGDDVGRRARRDEHGLEPPRPRLERQHDLADVAPDHRIDVILVDGALERPHRFGRGRMVVVRDDLDLAPIDAALGVDLVGGDLRGLRNRRAGDGLRFGDHADPDRPLVIGPGRRGQCEHESGRSRAEQACCARRSHFISRHLCSSLNRCGPSASTLPCSPSRCKRISRRAQSGNLRVRVRARVTGRKPRRA